MAPRSKPRAVIANKLIPTPVMTLDGHMDGEGNGGSITPISYFPDGKQLISAAQDKTRRRWDLQTGKEIEEARVVCLFVRICAVTVSRDGRWVVTAGGDRSDNEGPNACELETGKFEGHSRMVTCIDISPDSMLLASGSLDSTARIWSLDTGELVTGPFQSVEKLQLVSA